MSIPTTSLIVTTYNWKEALTNVLKSILHQSVMPQEVLVADDGSREDTRALVAKFAAEFPVPLHHIWQPDEGFQLSRIRNKALAQAQYDYIIQIDGDMILHRDFVRDHLRFAKPGFYTQGSRVRILQQYVPQVLAEQRIRFAAWQSGIGNKFNALRLPILSFLFAKPIKNYVYKTRGANMGYWRDDAYRINGFNEVIQGWGREDNEFVARMYNIGVQGRKLKLAGIAYHLDHREASRQNLEKNDQILQATIQNQIQRCEYGISLWQTPAPEQEATQVVQ